MNLETEASLIIYCNFVINFQEYSKHLLQFIKTNFSKFSNFISFCRSLHINYT